MSLRLHFPFPHREVVPTLLTVVTVRKVDIKRHSTITGTELLQTIFGTTIYDASRGYHHN